ncbi:hypothetical protein [Achromobacter sp. NCFB-sbj8-Ac1-l]|uniref:hypothetical protein n=1 Tax=unclassified Achromobacter TaxID=2626865 RepID=UPI0040468B7E
MPQPLTGRHLLAQTLRQFTRQVPGMFTAAPLAFMLFVMSLPGALLLDQIGGPRERWLLAAAIVCLLSLARLVVAWQHYLTESPARPPLRLDGAHLRVLALLTGVAALIVGLKSFSTSLGVALYFKMAGTPSTVLLTLMLLLWLAIWLPVMHRLGAWSLSLPQAALAGRYGLGQSRRWLRGRVWPFAALLLLLTASTAIATGSLTKALRTRWFDAIATGAGALIITLVLVLAFAIQCAIAYRDRGEA